MPESHGRQQGGELCSCGDHVLTELWGVALLEAFAEDEGVKWHYNSAGRAFWYLCQKCHERAWPEDKRGRAARPGVDDWLGAASGSNRRAAVRVSCGDLYITTPPPTFLLPSPRPRTSNAHSMVAHATFLSDFVTGGVVSVLAAVFEVLL